MLQLRPMALADIPVGMCLKGQAGWNQTEADWRRYLELEPDGCFVAMLNGDLVGTLTSCIFGPVAWIAMVLVDSRYRGRGIGTALVLHALEFLDSQAVLTARLDATPLGQPLYEKFGFEVEYALERYEGTLAPLSQPTEVETLRPEQMGAVLALDRMVTRTDRRKLLIRLAGEFPEAMKVICHSGSVEGFCAARPGSRARQIGPCIATGSLGVPLLDTARKQYAGERIFVDIPTNNVAAIRWAGDAGLTIQRRLVRMCRGPSQGDQVAALWASSGPEMG